MLYATSTALSSTEPELLLLDVLRFYLDSMNFIYEFDPYPLKISSHRPKMIHTVWVKK